MAKVQFPTQQELDQRKLLDSAPIGFRVDPAAYYVHYGLQPVVRTPEESKEYYRSFEHRREFFQRFAPDLGPSGAVALALWHLATGDHEFIVLVTAHPVADRLVVDTAIERLAPVFGARVKERRLKVVRHYSATGLHGTKFQGKRPTLIIVDGDEEFYADERCERWVDHAVKGALDHKGSLVMLGCPEPKPIKVEMEIPQDPKGDIKMVVDGDLYINGEHVGKMQSISLAEGFKPVEERV